MLVGPEGRIADAAAQAGLDLARVAIVDTPDDPFLAAQRAVALLRRAVQAGYNDAAHMKQDPDLNPLRQRDDFQKLLKEIDKGR